MRRLVPLSLVLAAVQLVAFGQDVPSASPSRSVTLAASGDILLHRKIVDAAEAHGWAQVFEGVARALSTDEIAFANLETPLVDNLNEVRGGEPPVLGAPAEAARALARAGIDVLGCANNHAFDQSPEGAARTVEIVRAESMLAVGADRDRDAAYGHQIIERQGLRVAFLSYTKQVNRGRGGRSPAAFVARLDDAAKLQEAIERARRDADVVVFAVHWSGDFVEAPRRHHRRLARQLVEWGVDVILGSGPHVLQEVERLPSERGEAVVAYSLGNLISNQGQRHRVGRQMSPRAHPAMRLATTRDGVFLRIGVSVAGGRVRVSRLDAEPLWTSNNFYWWWENPRRRELDIRVKRLADVDAALRAERLPIMRQALGPSVRLPAAEDLRPAAGTD